MARYRCALSMLIIGLLGSFSFGQGVIIDQRPEVRIVGSYTVSEVRVDATVRDQVAEVQVTQTFHNPTSRQLEAEYLFPLPHDGAISSLTLIVDGKEMPGRILSAEEARRIYEEIVRRKRDPALLEYIGRGLFKTSVFPIAPRSSSKVVMRYTQVLKRDGDITTLSYPLSTHKLTGKAVGELSVRVRLVAGQPIKSIYSPSHEVDISRPSEREAVANFTQRDAIPAGDFRLLYTLDDAEVGATLLSYKPADSEDGYFLLLASPGFQSRDKPAPGKTVIFVIDKSGSMSGKKIEQARQAARFVVNNLREGDTFNIIAYDDRVATFKPELQSYNDQTRSDALAFIDDIRDGGSTNIDLALTTAMNMLSDDKRPSYVLFLTDGLPTAGEQNEMKIAGDVTQANGVDARLIAFGVGYDVNARLLDRLTSSNAGVSDYVKPDDDIEAAVGRFTSRLTAPVLVNIQAEFAGVGLNRCYPRDLGDLFAGGQIIRVGRYRQSGSTTVRLTGTIDGDTRTFEYPATLAAANGGSEYAFIEKLWAVRRVGDLIDQIDLHGRSDELINELVELSKRHGIMTPYTAFLADEDVQLNDAVGNLRRAEEQAADLTLTSGRAGFAQREAKADYMAATAAPAAGVPVAQSTEGERLELTSVRNVADRTFFQKQGVWQDSTVTDEQLKNPIEIRQFSDEYFKLVNNLPREQRQYLNFTETVVVNLDGQTYRILAE